MTFSQAVAETNGLGMACCCPGKRALAGSHPNLICCDDSARFTGSIHLDQQLRSQPGHRNASRWDYGLGFKETSRGESAIWVAVHPASSSEVSAVLNKLAWLKGWLRNEAPALARLSRRTGTAKCFFWLATPAGVHIRPGSPQARRLQASGLDMPRRKLCLP